jgi:hypothetical protein
MKENMDMMQHEFMLHIAEKRAERLLRRLTAGSGLHSSAFRLNISAFCVIGVAFRGCLGGV